MARCTCAFFEVLTCASHPQSHLVPSLAEAQIWGLWVVLFALGVVHAPVFLVAALQLQLDTYQGAAQPATPEVLTSPVPHFPLLQFQIISDFTKNIGKQLIPF